MTEVLLANGTIITVSAVSENANGSLSVYGPRPPSTKAPELERTIRPFSPRLLTIAPGTWLAYRG